ncbi:MAG: AAA family ATPase [Phycisphaerales bacterium]
MNALPRFGRAEIIRAFKLLVRPGGITEVRALDAVMRGGRSYPATLSGYFDCPEKLADAVEKIVSARGIYIIPNAVDPALLNRAFNRIKVVGKTDPLTTDTGITRRRWLLVDLDAVRPTGISSTDAEHAAARQRAERVREHLRSKGWPEPILADSGNGWHLLYCIDLLPNDDGLVERCLAALSHQFSDKTVKVDTSVGNPARIWKLYGTLACKGDATPDRPHRMSRMMDVPEPLSVVTDAQLVELAGLAPKGDVRAPVPIAPRAGSLNLAAWLAAHIPDAGDPKPWQGNGLIWNLPACPFSTAHIDGAFVGQLPSGAITAGCHHDSCKGWGWKKLRAKLERGGGTLETGRNCGTLRDSGQTPNGNWRPSLSVQNLAGVKAEPVIWVWEGRIPAGMITVIAGDPGGGKSTFAVYVAACVSTGRPWIDNRDGPERVPGRVLILTAEDDTARTLVPRLILAGADMSLVDVLHGVALREGRPLDQFSLDRDLDLLRQKILEQKYELIIIDPITAYLGDKASESHNTSVMRGLMGQLKALCEETGVAVLVVSHLNKTSSSNNATYRVTGSLALPAAARAVYLLAKDPDDDDRRLLVIAKINVGPEPLGLGFRIGGDPPTLQFEDEPVKLTAREILSRENEKDTPDPAAEEAAEWLRQRLKGGPADPKALHDEAKKVKITAGALQKGSKLVGIIKGPAGFGMGWLWRLPNPSPATPVAPVCPSVPQTPPVFNVPPPPPADTAADVPPPPDSCRACLGSSWWRYKDKRDWTCGRCHRPSGPDEPVWFTAEDSL